MFPQLCMYVEIKCEVGAVSISSNVIETPGNSYTTSVTSSNFKYELR